MADDNPDDWAPWARAVWLIHARHGIVHNEKLGEEGIKGNPAEIPLHAVRGMIADLMHYVHERNKVFDEDDFTAFDDIVDDAHEQFIREREAIPDKDPEHMQIGIHAPAGRLDPALDALRQDLAKRHLAELEALNRKQAAEIQLHGPSRDQDQRHHQEFKKLVLDLADQKEHAIHEYREAALKRSKDEFPAELKKRLESLEQRQQEEVKQFEVRHEMHEPRPDFGSAELEEHRANRRNDLAEKHAAERERYIREFYKARQIAEQMEEESGRQKDLEPGKDLAE